MSSSSSSSAAPTVAFQPSPVKTGYSLPVKNSTIKRTVVATVTPASETNNVTLVLAGAGANRVELKNIAKDAAMGKISFDVRGLDATPANMSNGDTTIQAKIGGNVVGEVQAIVVIPKVHTRSLGTISYTNTAKVVDEGEPEVLLTTAATTIVTLTINDQFNNVLDSIYDGEKVVHEIFTGTITGIFDELYSTKDRDAPLAIELPDAVLKDGVKKDEYSVARSSKVAMLDAATRDKWNKFLAVINGVPNNNTFALRLSEGVADPATSAVTIKIQVHGHDVKFKSGTTEYDAVVRKFTQARTILTVPLNMAETPVTLTEEPPQ